MTRSLQHDASGYHVRLTYTSLYLTFIQQNWGMQEYSCLSYFASKHRLWVLVAEAVLTCTHNLCFEQKKKKKKKKKKKLRKICKLSGRVFVLFTIYMFVNKIFSPFHLFIASFGCF